MAANLPFQPSTGTTLGRTVKITANSSPSSVAGTLTVSSTVASAVVVTNNGTVLVFVRISTEQPPTATQADMPIPAASSRILSLPQPANGLVGLAVISSTTTAADVYFTPGLGINVQ